jgi:lipid II isoglutaminyl synthase (glutamine-hydrolysing)
MGLEGQELTVEMQRNKQTFNLLIPGTYNAYNALGALAVAEAAGIELASAASALAAVVPAFGRGEKVVVHGKTIVLLLIKNPTGFDQIIQTYFSRFWGDGPGASDGSSTRSSQVVIAINDSFADGRDVSWLWDAALEEFMGKKFEITASGTRAYDMALRLKYAEVKAVPEPDLNRAIENFLGRIKSGETAFILATYTAMLTIRKLLGRQSTLERFWKGS